MPCYSPLVGYRAKTINPTGKRSLVFNRNRGFSDMEIKVPCGQCIGCRIDKSRQWAIRCTHEAQLHERNCFITLTYDDDHLPSDLSVDKEELKRFFKRLRKKIGKFRYYACGEYGEGTQRPHYHAIIFGHDFSSDRKKHSVNPQGDILFTSKLLTQEWKNGHTLVSAFSYATAAYVARYIMKKMGGEESHDNYSRFNPATGEVWTVNREFALMSLKPGLGSGWFDKYSSDVFPSDYLVHQGKKHPVPKYYLNKIVENEKLSKQVKIKRKKAVKLTASDNTPDRLAVKESCKKSQITQLKRSL